MTVRELITKLGYKVDETGARKAEDRVRKIASNMKTFALGAVTAIGAIGGASIKAAADMETLQTSFEVMLGSAEKASQMIQDLRDFSVKTPFELEDLAGATQTLLQFGIAGEDILPTIQMLGDVAGSNRERFKSLALVFGQIQSTGKLMGQDLLQLINQGFNPLQVISEKTGKSVADLKDEMSKGLISAEMVTEAFQIATSEGGLFFQNLLKQSTTFTGLWSTLIGAMKERLIDIGQTVLPMAKEIVGELIAFTGGPLKEFTASISKFLVPLIRIFASLLQPLFSVLGSFADSFIPVLKVISGILGKILPPIVEVVGILFSDLAAVLMPIIQIIGALLIPVIQFLMPVIKIISRVVGILGKVLSIFVSVLRMLTPLFDILLIPFKLFVALLDGLAWVLGIISGWLDPVVSAMASFADHLAELYDWFLKLFSFGKDNIAGDKTPDQMLKQDTVNNMKSMKVSMQNNINVQGGGSMADRRQAGKVVGDAARSIFSIELQKIIISSMT